MKLRTISIAVVVGAAGLGLAATQRDKVENSRLDYGDLAMWKQMLGWQSSTESVGPKEDVGIMERTLMKDAIVHKLADGEIDLQQASTRFMEINSRNPTYLVGLDCTYPNMDRKEAVYRNVLDWTEQVCGNKLNYSSIHDRLSQQFEDFRKKGFPLPPIPLPSKAACE